MKKVYLCAFTLCTVLGLSAQEVVWQKDIKSSTQDFLSQVTTTIDQQYLITGSSIQSDKQQASGSKQNNGYDFHLVKLNQQGDEVWEKYFQGRIMIIYQQLLPLRMEDSFWPELLIPEKVWIKKRILKVDQTSG
jgi:hypothetical protein